MQISRQADYALRAVLYLARLDQAERAAISRVALFLRGLAGMRGSSTISQVARDQRIPSSFLAKIIVQLSVAGLLRASRFARGGVRLARDPEDITLLEVIEAIDGPIMLAECAVAGASCTFGEECPLRPVWCEAQNDLVNRLEGTSLAQVLKQNAAAA